MELQSVVELALCSLVVFGRKLSGIRILLGMRLVTVTLASISVCLSAGDHSACASPWPQ